MLLPLWLDYAKRENVAAAMFRGLMGASASWGELIAAAQVILGYYQDLSPSQTDLLYDEANALPLIAAARILDSASQPPSGQLPEERADLALNAAVAFAMYGNFPSASATIKRAFPHLKADSPSIAVLLATLSPNYLQKILPSVAPKTVHRRYLELLNTYLYTGDRSLTKKIRDLFIECLLQAESSFESSLYRSARICLSHIFRLCVFRVLKEECPHLGNDYIFSIVDSGVRVLLPPQYKAIVRHKIATSGGNVLVALPTSTGKTWLGELCLVSAFNGEAGIVCYVAPYIALGNQVAQSLSEHLPDTYKIHRLMGGFQDIEQLNPESNREVIVATPERLDILLRTSGHLIEHLRCVVCDEAHMLENDTRGIRLEGILTRLRLFQEKGLQLRLVLLSAVLSRYDAIQDWLKIPNQSIITDEWKPTARRLAFWKQNGRMVWLVGNEALRREGQTESSIIGESFLPWPDPDFYPPRHHGQIIAQEQKVYPNVAYLAEVLYQRYSGPILCICATKQGTRNMAASLANRFPETENIPEHTLSAIAKITNQHRFLLPMCDLLRRGIAFHNSTVPHDVRQLIEKAAKAGELKVVTATTTLAEGVDLPFRFTIVVDWLIWGAVGQAPMGTLLFKNVAGRCGRAGTFTEGDTIIFDNPVGPLLYTDPYRRDHVQQQVFLAEAPDELMSALQALFTVNVEKEPFSAGLASQLMAAIPENPEEADLPERFANFSFFSHRTNKGKDLLKTLTNIERSLLEETNGALAKVASPLHLTEFGKAANTTGLSPDSCRRVRDFLSKDRFFTDISQITCDLLQELGTLPEQSNKELKKTLTQKGSKFPVKPADFYLVISQWLKGDSRESIFASLPYVKRSKVAPPVMTWLEGLASNSQWDAVFDKFTDFITVVFESFVPWVMWACSCLNEYGLEWAKEAEWRLWSQMVEKGVDSEWAVHALTSGAPGGRKAIAIIGRRWPSEYRNEIDVLGLEALKERESRAVVQDIFQKAYLHVEGVDSPEGRNLLQLQNWLGQRAGVSFNEP